VKFSRYYQLYDPSPRTNVYWDNIVRPPIPASTPGTGFSAVVILHVHKYEKKVTKKFNSERLHEKHVVATWKLGNHLSIRL